jgi:hypothetical protein
VANERGRPPGTRVAVSHTGEILTPVDIERRITALDDALETLTYDLEAKATASARAEAAYKIAYAKERMGRRVREGTGPGGRCTNDEADDYATSKCEDLLTTHLIAEAVHGAAKDALKAKVTQMDGLRTLAANVRNVTGG